MGLTPTERILFAHTDVDLDAGTIGVDGAPIAITPVPRFRCELFAAGGLIPWMGTQRGSAH